jgi:hypothetical protein
MNKCLVIAQLVERWTVVQICYPSVAGSIPAREIHFLLCVLSFILFSIAIHVYTLHFYGELFKEVDYYSKRFLERNVNVT